MSVPHDRNYIVHLQNLSVAQIEAHEGGQFTWFSGAVSGSFIKLVDNELIEMSWRFSNWEEADISNVMFEWDPIYRIFSSFYARV